jgi:hypothetical protein
MSPEQIAEVIKRSQEVGCLPDGSRLCILCGDTCPDEPMYTGLWIPFGKKLQRRVGCSEERLANGGNRVVLYMLCPACYERATRNESVETEILRRVTAQ